MAVTSEQITAATKALTDAAAVVIQQVAQLQLENAQLKAQIAGQVVEPIKPPTYMGTITDHKFGNDMALTAEKHLVWMQDTNTRCVRIWHSIDPATGQAKWNKDSITLAREYLVRDPNIRVVICCTPDQNHPKFSVCLFQATFDDLVAGIPQAYRDRCYIELINEPNKPEFWNCTGGKGAAFVQMSPWSIKLQTVGFKTISPSITEPWQGNVKGHFAGISADVLNSFTHLGYHCYQNNADEFRKCLDQANVVAGSRGVALTEWGLMVWLAWYPPIEVFVTTVPTYVKAIAETTVLSAFYIGTPSKDFPNGPYLIDVAAEPDKTTILYPVFKAEYAKYK